MSHESDNSHQDDIDCLEAFDHLYAYLNDELEDELEDEQTRAKLEHHLGHCHSCYSRSQMEQALNERLKNAEKGKTPEALQKRLRDLLKDF